MRDVTLAIIMICIWGSNYAVAKIGLEDVPPFLIMALRFFVTALVLLPFAARSFAQMGPIFTYSIIVGLVHFGGIFGALAVSDAATVIIVSQINVPISILIAALFLGERFQLRHGIGIVIAIFGVCLYAWDPSMQTTIEGLIYCLVGAAAWSIGLIWMKARLTMQPIAINFWMAVFSVPLLVCASVLVGEKPWMVLDMMTPTATASIVYQAVGVVAIGYGIWNYLIRTYDVKSIAPLTLMVPFSGLFFAWLLLDENLSRQELTGGAMTILGVMILSLSRERLVRLLQLLQPVLAILLDSRKAIQK